MGRCLRLSVETGFPDLRQPSRGSARGPTTGQAVKHLEKYESCCVRRRHPVFLKAREKSREVASLNA